MRCSWIMWCILLLCACNKEVDFPNTQIIGHAATGLNAQNAIFHDNSREALEMALEMQGCDGVEIDIHVSASGKLWLFHDPDLSPQTKSSGCIGSKTDVELDKIYYKSIHQEKLLAFEKIAFERCAGKTLMLDLRHYDYCNGQIIDVQPFLDELNAIPQLVDGSIEVMVLLSNPEWAVHFNGLPFPVVYSAAKMDEAQSVLANFQFDGLIIKNSEISKEQVSALKSSGKKVIIFEVRSPKGIKSAFKKQPDYLVTDDLRATIIEKY